MIKPRLTREQAAEEALKLLPEVQELLESLDVVGGAPKLALRFRLRWQIRDIVLALEATNG